MSLFKELQISIYIYRNIYLKTNPHILNKININYNNFGLKNLDDVYKKIQDNFNYFYKLYFLSSHFNIFNVYENFSA